MWPNRLSHSSEVRSFQLPSPEKKLLQTEHSVDSQATAYTVTDVHLIFHRDDTSMPTSRQARWLPTATHYKQSTPRSHGNCSLHHFLWITVCICSVHMHTHTYTHTPYTRQASKSQSRRASN